MNSVGGPGKGFFWVILCVCCLFIGGCVRGAYDRSVAIHNNVAHWEVNAVSGEKTFVWHNPVPVKK